MQYGIADFAAQPAMRYSLDAGSSFVASPELPIPVTVAKLLRAMVKLGTTDV